MDQENFIFIFNYFDDGFDIPQGIFDIRRGSMRISCASLTVRNRERKHLQEEQV